MGIQSISSSGTAMPLPAAPQGSVPQPVAPPQLPAVTAQASSSQPQAAPDRAQVEEAIAKVKKQVQPVTSNGLDFTIDDSTGKTLVRITDRETGELIRQIPSQEMLEIAQSLDRMQGMLLRQKA